MRAVCKTCGAPAEVEAGVITRTCEHHAAGVAVPLSATCHGEGGAQLAAQPRRLEQFGRLLTGKLQALAARRSAPH